MEIEKTENGEMMRFDGEPMFVASDGVKVIMRDGTVKNYSEVKSVMEMPPGDWVLRLCRDTIIIADRSGNHPPYQIDKEGNWKVIKPEGKYPDEATYVQERTVSYGHEEE